MPITTYLRSTDVSREYPYNLRDSHLPDLLEELRRGTGQDWVIVERTITKKSWFKKTTILKYRLLKSIEGSEYQEIQFYQPDEPPLAWASGAPPSVVAAYITGLLSGLAQGGSR